jgi:hypothetical protein
VTVRTNTLIAEQSIGAGISVNYIVPASTRTIVKFVTVAFSGADLFSVDVTLSGSGIRRAIVYRTGAGANTSAEIVLGVVLVAGDRLSLTNRGTNAMVVTASGTELAVP